MLDPAATAAILVPPALPFSCCSGISPPQPSQHGMFWVLKTSQLLNISFKMFLRLSSCPM